MSSSLLTHHPTKGLWVLLAVLLNVIRFPFSLIYFIPPFMRQNPAWTYKQAVRVNILKNVLYHMSLVEMKTPLSLLPRSEKERWAVAKVTNDKHYTGILNVDPKIKPESIGGTWYPSVPGKEKPGFVVLHFHGGAFAIGDGRQQDAGFAAKTLLDNSDATHVFAPQYRLSTNPGCQFPAALQDAVTSYAYLINEVGIPANKIILSGDSAGGNLAVALTKYLSEHGTQRGLSLPACLLAWSPWVNPSVGLDKTALDRNVNRDYDYIVSEFGHWGASSYQPRKESGTDINDSYINFEHNTFDSGIPIFVSGGECEVLLNQIAKFSDDMTKKHPKNKIKFHVQRHAVHDCILVGHILGFEKVAADAVKQGNDFLRSLKK